jgi:cell fate (sporulation/competence/biofilm development) regulator YlbF (YheA/YmcA/DUF963 family)
MTTTATSIEDKIQELCAAIIADEEVNTARERAEAFLADDEAVALYRRMSTLGRELHQRDHDGVQPSVADVNEYTSLQRLCSEHPGVTSFVESRQVLQGIAEMVSGYVSFTLEKGRIPSDNELWGDAEGGCGEGCGCH